MQATIQNNTLTEKLEVLSKRQRIVTEFLDGYKVIKSQQEKEIIKDRILTYLKQIHDKQPDAIIFQSRKSRPLAWILRGIWLAMYSYKEMPPFIFQDKDKTQESMLVDEFSTEGIFAGHIPNYTTQQNKQKIENISTMEEKLNAVSKSYKRIEVARKQIEDQERDLKGSQTLKQALENFPKTPDELKLREREVREDIKRLATEITNELEQ